MPTFHEASSGTPPRTAQRPPAAVPPIAMTAVAVPPAAMPLIAMRPIAMTADPEDGDDPFVPARRRAA